MSNLQEIRTVIFDKNLNRVIQSDPIYEALFENIYTFCYDLYDQLTGLMTEKNILSLTKHEIKCATRDKKTLYEYYPRHQSPQKSQ